MHPPSLTVAVAWNGEYELESLLGRASNADFVFEVLLAAASKSAHAEALKLMRRHSKLRVLPGGDTGIYNAWNKLIVATRTPYVTFHGADDLLVPSAEISAALAKGIKSTRHTMLVFTAHVVDRQGHTISMVHHDELSDRLSLGRLLSPLTPEVVYPTAVLLQVGGVDENFKIAGDADLYFKTRLCCDRWDINEVFVEMADGGASASAKHAWIVYCENRRIAIKNNQIIPFRNLLTSWVFLGLRRVLFNIGGERFAARWTDYLRLLAGKAPRYTR